MIEFHNVSDTVHYDQSKEKNELLSLINATISHELRNPLNSLIAENTAIAHIYNSLETIMAKLKKKEPLTSEIVARIDTDLEKLKHGLHVQESSAKLMTFLIHDFLDYSQIKAGSFRIRNHRFNIVDTVKSVMDIQRRKAESQNI